MLFYGQEKWFKLLPKNGQNNIILQPYVVEISDATLSLIRPDEEISKRNMHFVHE